MVNGSMRVGLLIPAMAVCALAQTAGFEAATIKPPADQDAPSSISINKGAVTTVNTPLDVIIGKAYGLAARDVQAPAWTESARFDIVAKPPANVSHPDPEQMLQTLLAERFHLKVHVGSKEVTGFILRAGKEGLKMEDVGPQAKPGVGIQAGGGRGQRIIAPGGMTMKQLADQLSHMQGAPVEDRTETTDYYAVSLQYLPEALDERRDSLPASLAQLPTLFAALQEKGLRLERAKVTVPTVIVDSVDKAPTAN